MSSSVVTNPTLRNLLADFKQALHALYGDRLVDVILFGSYARQTATEDSDIDIMVVLQDPVSAGDEILRIGNIKTDFNLKYDVLISVVPIAQTAFFNYSSPLLKTIRLEGIHL